jgi:N-carbamoyl-L-amino-acid hydrolase
VQQLARRRGRRLPFGLEVVGFSEEEGQRYKAAFLGSGALTGDFDPAWLDQRDADGITMREAMAHAGLPMRRASPGSGATPARYLGFVEVHIEQGPVLNALDLPLGVVTSINGSARFLGEFTGMASHAGTTPMGQPARRGRRRGRAACSAWSGARSAEPDLVATVGMLRGAQRLDQRRARARALQPGHARHHRPRARRAAIADVCAELRRASASARGVSVHLERDRARGRRAERAGLAGALGGRPCRRWACPCNACPAAPATTR